MTCAFLCSAVKESEDTIRRLLKRRPPGQRVVVAGCLVERFGPKLKRRLPGVDLFVSLAQIHLVPSLLSAEAHSAQLPSPPTAYSSVPRLLSTPPHYAYLKIAEGCSNRCSYCLIPAIRGPFRSRPLDDILQEAQALARIGTRELILIAQDTTAYGQDIYAKLSLPQLLHRLSRIHGIHWLRLMYAHPAHITDELLHEFETNPKLCRYVDLPLQHCSDRILRQMNRFYTRRHLERLIGRLRTIPDMSIRTTMIVGFPGETRTEFEELLDFVRNTGFDRLGAYAFSPEPGTPAAGLANQIPGRTRQARLAVLMKLQASISRRRLRRLLGRSIDVVIDSPGVGRTQWDAPEIDGTVRFLGRCPKPGSTVHATVVRTATHDITCSLRS